MAKRRRALPARTHVYDAGSGKPGFSRKRPSTPPKRTGLPTTWLALGVAALAIAGLVAWYALSGGLGAPAASTRPSAVAATVRPSFNIGPPAATPLASEPSAPQGDGTRATIETEAGNIEIELYTDSAPVATENFINLANAGYYDGVVFHRIVPDFMIQGGDPEGTGRGGPGYTIPDEPFAGEYTRGTVAMARTNAPNSQGSQFFIVVADSEFLEGGGYTIFGRVVSGMEVADEIVSGPNANDDPGGRGGTALDPVAMTRVTITQPGT